MRKEDLERNLSKGNSFGFVKEVKDTNFIGWIKLFKRSIPKKFFETHNEQNDPDLFHWYLKKAKFPYVVHICEVSKYLFEIGKSLYKEDYKLNESFEFSTLDEAEIFLNEKGYLLENIKWIIDIPTLY